MKKQNQYKDIDEHRKRVRENNRKRYYEDKEYREYQKRKSKIYLRALRLLAKKHKQEFEKIQEELEKENDI